MATTAKKLYLDLPATLCYIHLNHQHEGCIDGCVCVCAFCAPSLGACVEGCGGPLFQREWGQGRSSRTDDHMHSHWRKAKTKPPNHPTCKLKAQAVTQAAGKHPYMMQGCHTLPRRIPRPCGFGVVVGSAPPLAEAFGLKGSTQHV